MRHRVAELRTVLRVRKPPELDDRRIPGLSRRVLRFRENTISIVAVKNRMMTRPLIVYLAILAGVFLATTGYAEHGIDVAGMDRTVVVKSPADLYNFANGTWFDRTSIPADKAYVGTLEEVQRRDLATLRPLAEKAAASIHRSVADYEGLVGTIYRSAMDSKALESAGITPLQPELGRIDAVNDRTSLARELAHLTTLGIPAGFSFKVAPEVGNTYRLVLAISQVQLIMPDRQLYLDQDNRSKAIREQYLTTLGKLFSLAKQSDPVGQATAALGLEEGFAYASAPPVQLKDLNANHHLFSQSEVATLAPVMDWRNFFSEAGIQNPGSLDVCQPKFLSAFDKALIEVPLNQWRSYLRALVLYSWSPYLTNAFVKSQRSLSNDITGITEMEPRWERAISSIVSLLGDAAGRLFIEKAFSQDAKDSALRLVENLRSALWKRIHEIDWMSDECRAQAITKLDMMVFKVGFPNRWRNYAELQLKGDSYLQDVQRIQEFEWKRNLSKLGRPLDRSEWQVSPASADVFYNPVWNELVVPAGILQPGFFDPAADDASNYGGIGAIVAREMTHGFDAVGRLTNGHGNLHSWWSADVAERFFNAASRIRTQYDAYRSPEGFHVDGTLTLSDNIADIGGVSISFLAYKRALNGAKPPSRDGLSGDQRFFVAFAQNYRAHFRPDVAEVAIAKDTHAPDAIRVLGAVTDQPEFYRAFNLTTPKALPNLW